MATKSTPILWKINTVSGIASAWLHNEAGTRAFVVRNGHDGMYHWHVTEHGRNGEPTTEGREANAERAFVAATKALGSTSYKLS